MDCNCNDFGYDQQVMTKQASLEFQKKVHVGVLYKCKYCGSLWVEYSVGHGWAAYYKKTIDTKFEEPIESLESSFEITHNDEMKIKWNELVKKIPIEKEKIIQGMVIKQDIMSVLKYIFTSDKAINNWLFTYRDKKYGFETPIEILNQKDGIDIIKILLLEQIDNIK